MQSVLIVIHLLVVIALVGVVLLQRSEGGALGTGGGGGFMTGRGQANALSRATAILGALFFASALHHVDPRGLEPRAALDHRQPAPASTSRARRKPARRGNLLDQLKIDGRTRRRPARRRPPRPRPLRAAPRRTRRR